MVAFQDTSPTKLCFLCYPPDLYGQSIITCTRDAANTENIKFCVQGFGALLRYLLHASATANISLNGSIHRKCSVCSGIDLFYVSLQADFPYRTNNYSINYNKNIICTAQVPSSNSIRIRIIQKLPAFQN
jgi:hypothetical protein